MGELVRMLARPLQALVAEIARITSRVEHLIGRDSRSVMSFPRGPAGSASLRSSPNSASSASASRPKTSSPPRPASPPSASRAAQAVRRMAMGLQEAPPSPPSPTWPTSSDTKAPWPPTSNSAPEPKAAITPTSSAFLPEAGPNPSGCLDQCQALRHQQISAATSFIDPAKPERTRPHPLARNDEPRCAGGLGRAFFAMPQSSRQGRTCRAGVA